MFDVVRFWLDKGVDGFRLDVFLAIYKDAEFRDNPFKFKLLPGDDDPSGFFQQAKYTLNQPETFALAKELRNVCNETGERLLLGEAAGDRRTLQKFLGDEINDGLTLVFDFEMLGLKFTAEYFRELIENVEAEIQDPFMPVYVFSNHDKHRSIRRLGAALDPIPHKFKFLPRFIPDLLGLTINRDEVRTPMQWDGTKNAGFSSAEKTWLSIHENYVEVNVENESKESDSRLNTIRALLKIRKEEMAIKEGSLDLIDDLPKEVLGYTRKLSDAEIMIFMNFEKEEKEFPISEDYEQIFKLAGKDSAHLGKVGLGGFGGIILKKLYT